MKGLIFKNMCNLNTHDIKNWVRPVVITLQYMISINSKMLVNPNIFLIKLQLLNNMKN